MHVFSVSAYQTYISVRGRIRIKLGKCHTEGTLYLWRITTEKLIVRGKISYKLLIPPFHIFQNSVYDISKLVSMISKFQSILKNSVFLGWFLNMLCAELLTESSQ